MGVDMKHVMIDLETWGTRPGCALRSIGAVVFDPRLGETGAAFYANISRWSCEFIGLKIEPETEKWWAEQSAEARAAFASGAQWSVDYALGEFSHWFESVAAECIWSHGAPADIAWLDAAYAACRMAVPWHYRAPRDTRTLYWLANFDPKSGTPDGIEHNALHDAIFQARCVQAAMHKLRTSSDQTAGAHGAASVKELLTS
jgi:hypothetical protein